MANGLYAVLSKYSNDPCVGLEENKDSKLSSRVVVCRTRKQEDAYYQT